MLEIKTNWPADHSKLKFLGHHKSIFGGVYLVKLKALGLRLKGKSTPWQIFSWKFTKIHRVTISQKNMWMKD